MDDKLTDMLDLHGKVALVTGAGRGIGEAIAERLAEAGAAVLVTDIDADLAAQVVTKIKAAGGKASALKLDVRQAGAATTAVEAAITTFGGIHILVNNAAIFPAAHALEITEDQWDLVQDVNLKGAFFLAQAAARAMIAAAHGGKIINITSLGYKLPPGLLSHYDASKGGVVSLTQSLAKEFGPHGILVNAVAPGAMATPGGAIASAQIAAKLQMNMETLPIRSVLGRYGTSDDVAKVVYFLASGLADYVTGSVIEAGGGYGLH